MKLYSLNKGMCELKENKYLQVDGLVDSI
jgi:hypothetical protein